MPTSSSPPEGLRELAEAPDRFTRLSDDVRRFADGRACVLVGPTWASVSDVRVAAREVEPLVAEVRERVGPGRETTWWLGPSARPAGLEQRLRALGLADPADGTPLVHALACWTPPPQAPPGIVVRRAATIDDFRAAHEVMWEAFATPPERRAVERARLGESFAAARRAGTPVTFVAELDGRIAGVGRSIVADRGVFLVAGATAPWARGRGLYRALVRARWDDAVARGTPALVTEAVPGTSYPILERLGFVEVCTIRRLEDPR